MCVPEPQPAAQGRVPGSSALSPQACCSHTTQSAGVPPRPAASGSRRRRCCWHWSSRPLSPSSCKLSRVWELAREVTPGVEEERKSSSRKLPCVAPPHQSTFQVHTNPAGFASSDSARAFAPTRRYGAGAARAAALHAFPVQEQVARLLTPSTRGAAGPRPREPKSHTSQRAPRRPPTAQACLGPPVGAGANLVGRWVAHEQGARAGMGDFVGERGRAALLRVWKQVAPPARACAFERTVHPGPGLSRPQCSGRRCGAERVERPSAENQSRGNVTRSGERHCWKWDPAGGCKPARIGRMRCRHVSRKLPGGPSPVRILL
jgi:hypothetical protein